MENTFTHEELTALKNLVDFASGYVGPGEEPLLLELIEKLNRLTKE